MNDTANSFFIELSTLFDPSGFDEAQEKLTQILPKQVQIPYPHLAVFLM